MSQPGLFGQDEMPSSHEQPPPPRCYDCGTTIPHARARRSKLCRSCGKKVGRAERDDALDAMEVYRAQLLAGVRHRLKRRAHREQRSLFTANDAHEALEAVIEGRKKAGLPVRDDADRRLLGAVWMEDCWSKTGDYVQSNRPDQHARPIAVWRYNP